MPTAEIKYKEKEISDLIKKKMVDGNIGRLYYDNQPLVYTWTNNTVK